MAQAQRGPTATTSISAASSVSINSQSLLAIDVGNGSLLDSSDGTLDNDGTVRILAGAGVDADDPPYAPISAGTWEGTGVYQAVGGTWNDSTHEFTVSDVVEGNSGTQFSLNLAENQRALIADDGEEGTGWALGASFLHKADGETNLSLTATAVDTLDELQLMIGSDETVLGAWNIVLSGDGYTEDDPVYLSFDVGEDYKRGDLAVWYFDGSDWSSFDAMDLTVNDGWASFTASEFSGYAVSTVPEPGTLALLLAAGLGMAAWARRTGKLRT